nr:(s)-ureidoglycine aminohydrolase [Quercus suber]
MAKGQIVRKRWNSKSGLPPSDVERFIFVVQGAVSLTNISGVSHELMNYADPKYSIAIIAYGNIGRRHV